MKKARLFLATLSMSAIMCITAMAGEWKQDQTGWWYQNDDGSYQTNQWFQDFDGTWYYLNESGYMLTNGTAPDGRQIGADGKWIEPITGEFKAVLKEVKLFEVFENQGRLKFQLNEGAKNLSGGQRQRLALARALLRESDVYIFDEATNNVDRESEEIILKIMKRLAKDKIVIFITHRMAHCKESQLTFVMKEGRLIQQGSYEELFKLANLFRELVENQKNLERIIENER